LLVRVAKNPEEWQPDGMDRAMALEMLPPGSWCGAARTADGQRRAPLPVGAAAAGGATGFVP